MPLITNAAPESWQELEEMVTAILNESGMAARRQVRLELPRGNVNVDVYAEENTSRVRSIGAIHPRRRNKRSFGVLDQ